MIQKLNQIFRNKWVQVEIKWKSHVSIDCSIYDESSWGMKLIGFAPHRQGCVSSLLFGKFWLGGKKKKKKDQILPECVVPPVEVIQ